MAEEGWRVNARGRRVPSRVTSNMSEFVTKGKLTEDERRREGRRTKTDRKATPRDTWGNKRPVTRSTGGKDSARQKRIETVRKYNKRAYGGVNPKVTSAGERTKLERRGAGTAKSRYSGGRRVSVTPGATPITKGDGIRGGKSDPQGRHQRSLKSTHRGPTERGKEFEVGPHAKVTKGKGGYAGYRYVKPGTNEPIRKVDPPDTRRGQRRSGQGRTNTTSPNAADPKRTGPNRVTGGARIGKPISGAKSSSSGPNNTGARRTGGGRRGQISSKGGSGGSKGGFNVKGTGYAKKNFWSGETPEVRKARVEKLHNAMRQGKAWGKHMNPRAKQLIKMGASLAGGGKGRLAKALLRELGFASLEKFKQMRDEGRKKEKRPVANLPADYKKTEKREFRKDKRRRRTKRLVKKR